jgi:hypothetical protein
VTTSIPACGPLTWSFATKSCQVPPPQDVPL